MKEVYLFLKRFLARPRRVGSLIPSSKHLAKEIAKYALPSKRGRRYLEVGGGSGALTPSLVANLTPLDQLDIVEIDPQLCHVLRKKFDHFPNITIYETSILDFDSPSYDVVVSSLPLNSFSPELVRGIFAKFEGLVKPTGVLSYFEYVGLTQLKKSCLFGKPLANFQQTLKMKKAFTQKHCCGVDHIWWNFPPARIIHCRHFRGRSTKRKELV